MKREIKFSLVFRDMWQSAGKYVPTVDQLTRVAPAITEICGNLPENTCLV